MGGWSVMVMILCVYKWSQNSCFCMCTSEAQCVQVILVYKWSFSVCTSDPPAYGTSSAAQGGGASFKKRKTIGEIACCESRMSEQKHWPTD